MNTVSVILWFMLLANMVFAFRAAAAEQAGYAIVHLMIAMLMCAALAVDDDDGD